MCLFFLWQSKVLRYVQILKLSSVKSRTVWKPVCAGPVVITRGSFGPNTGSHMDLIHAGHRSIHILSRERGNPLPFFQNCVDIRSKYIVLWRQDVKLKIRFWGQWSLTIMGHLKRCTSLIHQLTSYKAVKAEMDGLIPLFSLFICNYQLFGTTD